ncbi:MAG TPA: hypothetical protein VHR66_21125 [Gemmataceae bacterium]|nr:hypothetical protein [Gemmataceae bacterium]
MAESEPKKSTPLPWVLLSGILGIFAVGVPQTTNAPSAKKEEKKEADAVVQAIPDEKGNSPSLVPVFDFHKAVRDHGNLQPLDQLRQNLHGYKTEFLIATVPDPVDSPYGNAFDYAVDAIQRAIEKKDGYVLDRCWLPWDVDRKAKPKPGDPPSNLRERHPGVLLFRHGRDKARNVKTPGLFVVFLVGETPMSGIHKQALYSAIKLMAEVGHPENEPVRIVGPYFSGSQTSLQFVIGDWWKLGDSLYSSHQEHPTYRFNIITGNATAVRKSEYFGFDANKETFPSWRQDGVTFGSTVIPTRTTLGALLHFMTRRDGSGSQEPLPWGVDLLPGKVAILTESNTAFGKAFDDIKKDQLITLRFPLHISRVKNEYNSATKEKDKKTTPTDDDPLASLSIADDQSATEGVPSQGGSATTAINGQVLSRILQTIAREQCRYVGVIASDSRDKLFLIRLIREHCPDVRVFVTDGDLLLTHPEYQYYMRGVIIGSTYPLVPRNQNWVNGATRDRILFASVGAQGSYNATLMHLGLNDQLLEYSAPAFALRDPNRPDIADNRPPIWVSMVAPNGTIVPLQLYTRYDDKYGYLAPNELPDEVDGRPALSGIDFPGAMLPVGLGILTWWMLLIVRAWGNPNTRLFWRSGSLLTLPDLFYRNIILGSQVLLAVPVLIITWTFAEARGFQPASSIGLIAISVFFLAALTLGMVKPLCRRGVGVVFRGRPLASDSGALNTGPPDSRIETITWLTLNLGLFLLVVGFSALCLFRFWMLGDFARRALFFIRAVDLSTGLSPLTPLFFVCSGYAAWGFFQLKRTHLAERFHVPTPYPADEMFRRLQVADLEVRDEVTYEAIAVRHAKPIAGAMIGLGGFGLAVWLQSLPTVEGWAWDLLFFVGFAGLFLLSATTLVRLFFLWGCVKVLLDAIASQPMMRSFGRLPVKVTEVFGRYFFTQNPHLSHLQVPAHQLRLLVEAVENDPQAPDGLRGLKGTADEIESTLSVHLAAGRQRGAARRAERLVREKLSVVAGRCLEVLAPRGRELAVDDAFGSGPSKDETATAEPAWVRLAESVAATQVVIYISQFFVQLRNLVWAAVVTSSLLLMAATSYPFHPEKLLLLGLIALSGAGMVAVIYVLIEMNRDEVVSRVTRTTPGKFSFDSGFLGSFFTYIVPAAGVLVAQLSGSFRWLLEPILRVMK